MKKYNFILFGGNRLKENAPMTIIIDFLTKKKIDFIVISDSIHLKKLISKSETFGSYLKKNKIPFLSLKKLKLKDLKKFTKFGAYGLSTNSIWKFTDDIIKYFDGNLYNYHSADLPTERGAGCITWRILLKKEKYNNLNIHKVDNRFDQGDIVLSKKSKKIFKNALPVDIYKYQIKLELSFLLDFLKKLLNKKYKFKIIKQNNSNSYYWPRLNSDIDGQINWNWNAEDIVSFIKGFSYPFNGAFSFIGKSKIRIFNASSHTSKIRFHPFQNGIIFRFDKKNIFVAATRHFIKISINEMVCDLNKNDFLVGKRLK